MEEMLMIAKKWYSTFIRNTALIMDQMDKKENFFALDYLLELEFLATIWLKKEKIAY